MLTLSALILMLLVLATLTVQFQLRFNTSSELSNNQTRIRTWWVIYFICIPAFYLGGYALILLAYALIYWAAFEFSRLYDIRINFIRVVFLTLSIIGCNIIIDSFINLAHLFFIVPIMTLGIALLVSASTITRVVIMLVFFITSILSIQLISQLSTKLGYDSGLVLLFLFFITAANDIFQYLCGKLFGHKQLSPNLSPNKTIEGALGGIFITGLIFAFTLPHIISVTWATALFIGFFVSVLGISGDLAFSYFKRLAGVKDSGSSMPGHGGLLDRIDSLTLTAPGFGLCLSLVN